jgi:uncharacterized membrane protein YfcA
MDFGLLVVLGTVAFTGGVAVTSVGPGGIFVVAALYGLTALPTAVVAGTSSVTFVGGSLLGALGYIRSGDMDWALALIIGTGGALGTRLGVFLNALVSRRAFGMSLGVLLGAVGLVILLREWGYLDRLPTLEVAPSSPIGIAVFGVIGLAIGTAGGLFGIGGAALVPPALVLVGVPMIAALAVTQIAVVFIAAAAAISYTVQGAIAIPLVFVVAGAYLLGAVGGWRLAKHVDPSRLVVVLGLMLIGLMPVLVYRSLSM